MTKLNQIWKCNVCGNIIEVLHEGADALVCCGKPMALQEEKTKEQEGKEKHVPIIKDKKVKIGEVPHPMTDEHYIEWIEIVKRNAKRAKKFLKPGDKPETSGPAGKEVVGARAYCNIQGRWEQIF